MPMLTISLDGRELQRVPLTQIRTTVGRRPYNDLVIEHLCWSVALWAGCARAVQLNER